MNYIRFLARVAFICNICFLIAIIIKFVPNFPQTEIGSVIIVLGYIVAIIINAVVNICLIVLRIMRKTLSQIIPLWLIIINLLFLTAEIIFFLK